jgi:hypothetical protein
MTTTDEIHGDRSLLYDVSEVSFHLRMGKKRTENYLHYLWLEKIIIPVRYRKIGSEPYWEKSSIDFLLKITKEEWDDWKIPEFDPKKNYKSMILKFPISKTKNTIPMKKEKTSAKKKDDQQAINCRIPIPTYNSMQEITAITKKPTGAFVADCILYYIGSVTGEFKNKQPDYLKIDEFGYNMKHRKM